MNDSKIPVRYAKALFDLALEANVLDKVYEDIRALLQVCLMPEVRHVMDNPVITPEKKKEILKTLAGDKIESLTGKFINLIFTNGREHNLATTCRYFINLTRRQRNIRLVNITTAVPVSEKVKNEIINVLAERSGEKIDLVEKVDRSIMGGFILRIDDAYIDASVRSRLNRFRKEFSLTENAE